MTDTPETAPEVTQHPIEVLQRMLDVEISRTGPTESFMIRSGLLRDLLAEIERHRTTPEAARQDVREAGWLIETKFGPHTHWLKLDGKPWPRYDVSAYDGDELRKYAIPFNFTKDASEALRFARKDDAEACMAMFQRFLIDPVATEHEWPAALSTSPLANETGALRGMETAPKDGSYILAVYKSLDGYALQLHGRAFVVRHEGQTQSGGYDLGWALFPGHGGVPDKCFSGWAPLPAALSPDDGEGK